MNAPAQLVPLPPVTTPAEAAPPLVPTEAIDLAQPRAAAPPMLNVAPIDLGSALALAGVQNPELMVARQRVVEAAALRQFAAAQILPNLNAGMNYDDHTGTLQQSSGRVIEVTRQALYVGAGANAVAAGTVNIPGIQYNLNVSQAIYGYLTARQQQRTRELNTLATRNDVLMRVANSYVELVRAECLRAISIQVRDESAEVARITAAHAQTGEGRIADADRAATELRRREAELFAAEGDVLIASARLCQLLNLDPSTRLHATDGWLVPSPIVPDQMPLSELLAIAILRRPEMQAQQSAVREAWLSLDAQRVLPFSPQLLVGYSAGGFGGGSNRADLGAQSEFGNFNTRTDLDVITYWTLQNMGIGNRGSATAHRSMPRGLDWARTIISNYKFSIAYGSKSPAPRLAFMHGSRRSK
jgi:outer membrane protein TolC